MKKRKLKFFSLILSLILVLVSVPTVAFSEEISSDDISEEITTEFQSDLSITEQEEVVNIGDLITPNIEVPGPSTVSYQQIETVPDGIYAFENVQNANWYMFPDGALSDESHQMKQRNFATSPSIRKMQRALFVVTNIPGTLQYYIRLAANPNYTLTYTSNGVATRDVTADSTVPIETFRFVQNSYGYSIVLYGSSQYIGANSTKAYNDLVLGSSSTPLTSWNLRAYRTYISDGVYAFKNKENFGLWMDTQHDSYLSGKHAQQYAQQYAYTLCPTESFSRGGLFKIKQKGDTGLYTVRLMTNNLLTWQIGSDGYVWSEAIDSDDLNVSEDKLFAIVYDNNGFMLVPSNSVTTTITATPNSPASGNSGAPASYLTSTERASATNSARWTMFKYTGADKCGVTIIPNASLTSFEEDGAVAGSTYTFESAVWYTYSSINDNVIVVTPSNSNVADVVWNNSNYTTTVTVKNFGKLSFDVNIWRASSGAPQTLYGARYTYNAIPKEGTYYLQNKYSQKYAYVDSPSATDGTTVQQWNFHAGFPERWQVEYVNNSGGYVRLKSLFSEKYLSVDPNDSTKIKQYSSPGDNSLWRFELLDDYAVKIICKASESSGKVLAVPLNSTENGVDLTQRTYTDNSDYSDEWRLRGDKTINLAVIYDQAYLKRYTNANSRINDELSVLKEKYWNEFGITVNITLLSSFYSYADEYCSTDYDAECNHASDDLCDDSDLFVDGNVELHDYHHTNVYNNMLRIPFPNISNEVKIAYWGHDYCTEHNHSGRSFNGLAYDSIGLAIITNFSSQTSETKTLIHEFGHFYGVIDHYGSSGLSTDQIIVQTGNNGYNRNCIYGENRENDDVLKEYIICDGCKSIIENNKNLYTH